MTAARRFTLAAVALLAAAALTGCLRLNIHGDPERWAKEMQEAMAVPLRVATYNTSLFDKRDGGLVARLANGDAGARKIAAVLQRVRPDVVLLNEFDFDPAGRAADLFQQRYLEVAQPGGGAPLHYRYRYLAPVNTGVPSGLDLDRNGEVGASTALAGENEHDRRQRGNDAWGYGLHPGQYGMLVLSRYPINRDAVRTFQQLKWSAMPGAHAPVDPTSGAPWYPPQVWSQLRLSSKSHWDVPIATPFGVVHLLAAHPTPPVFDGPENRNGWRNFDEIGLWARYLTPGPHPWLCDDRGRCGGLPADASFVIVGDLNADPQDGDGGDGAIEQLLDHPRVNSTVVPHSAGAAERAAHYDLPRQGDPHSHTGDFGARTGTLRLDYVLPSRDLRVLDAGVFWPTSDAPAAEIANGSDHHLVWLDLAPAAHANAPE